MPQMASQMVISGANLNSRPCRNLPRFSKRRPALPSSSIQVGQGQSVLPARLQSRPRHRHGDLLGRRADQFADQRTWPRLHRPQFLDTRNYQRIEVRKGPYWADVGDFDNAGALNISLRDSIGQNIQSVTAGSFGYTRLLSYGSTKIGGGSLLYAGEFNT